MLVATKLISETPANLAARREEKRNAPAAAAGQAGI
jgi:hypothetical protein